MSILGIDIGTTGVKAVIFSEDGKILGSGFKENFISYPKPGWAELDPKIVTESVTQATKQALKMNISNDQVQSLSVSTMGEVACPLSKKGELLYNAILHFDKRGEEQNKFWENFGKERIFKITGMPLHSMYTLNKLLWLRDNEPQKFKKIDRLPLLQDYFLHSLGLEPLIDYSLASRTMAFDVINKKWSEEILDYCQVDKKIFSKPVESGTIAGRLSSKAALELGLKKGVTVVVGTHDQPAATLGSGVIKEGIAMDSTGTVECVAVTIDEPNLNKILLDNNITCYCHCIPGKFIVHGFVFSAGSILKWYRDTFADAEILRSKKLGIDAYELILKNVDNNPSSIFVLPHFSGSGTPYMDFMSKGILMGLTLSTSKSDIVKAILEGISYEMMLNINIMRKVGIKINELRAIGGGAKSDKWLQLKADIFGLPIVSLDVSEASCLGVAMLAGKSTGLFNSLEESIKAMVKEKKTYLPNEKRMFEYSNRMSIYSKIYDSTREISHQIHKNL